MSIFREFVRTLGREAVPGHTLMGAWWGVWGCYSYYVGYPLVAGIYLMLCLFNLYLVVVDSKGAE